MHPWYTINTPECLAKLRVSFKFVQSVQERKLNSVIIFIEQYSKVIS
uniref:Uncharacterized protein n=1 Tax=Anguilla anguilla TaxID=7936 RepID=A0A0E9RGG2_ANGAN